MRNYLILAALLLCAFRSDDFNGQKIYPVQPGHAVPEISFQTFIGSTGKPGKKIKLSDFKGKMVIIDFFGTSCGPCIAKMPFLDSLQKRYAGDLKLILVCQDAKGGNYERLSRIIRRLQKAQPEFDLTYAIEDTTAEKLFPHMQVPHYAWIDKAGIYRNASFSEEVTDDNVKKVLEGKDVNLTKTDYLDFRPSEPLFKNGNGGPERNVKFRSMITGYIDGLVVRGPKDYISPADTSNISHYYLRNKTFRELYCLAYNVNYPVSRIVFDFKAPDMDYYATDFYSANYAKSVYCYELSSPPISLAQVRSNLQIDLYRTFGLKAKKETREMRCLVIKNKDGMNYGNNLDKFGAFDPDRVLYNVNDITTRKNQSGTIPVIDETSQSEKYLMAIEDADLNDIDKLKLVLEKNGFSATYEKRALDVFVIYESLH